MREILGYAPVEPDGSVRIKVPANVAFAITVLDANGRRIGAAPRQLAAAARRPGIEVQRLPRRRARRVARPARRCSPPSTPARRRTGVPFPNTEPRVLRRLRRNHGAGARAHQLPDRLRRRCTPSVDLVYDDVWTDAAAAGRAPDREPSRAATSTSRRPRRRAPDCMTALARRLPRHDPLRAAHPSAVGQAAHHARRRRRHGAASDHTCTCCHSSKPSAARATQLPAGQLELTDGPSADEPDPVPRLSRTARDRQRAGTRRRRAAGPPRADRRRPGDRRCRSSRRARRRVDERRQRRRLRHVLLQVRPGRHARGLADARGVEARLRMARHRRAVLQRPVRRAASN